MNCQWVTTLLLVMANCQDLHEFLGLNVPFFNHSADVVFTAQVGGLAFISCEVYNLNNKVCITCTTGMSLMSTWSAHMSVSVRVLGAGPGLTHPHCRPRDIHLRPALLLLAQARPDVRPSDALHRRGAGGGRGQL